MENFEKSIKEANEIHCIEAHILVYLGKKKEAITDLETWKSTRYDSTQHSEAIIQKTEEQEKYNNLIDKTYEFIFNELIKTLPKWDIYSITKLFSNILKEINQEDTSEDLKTYEMNINELLKIDTINIPNSVPSVIQEPIQE